MSSSERRRQRRAAQIAMRRRERKGQVLPQDCPECGSSLVDPSVPEEYRWAQGLFSRAVEWPTTDGEFVYQCPDCKALFGKHPRRA